MKRIILFVAILLSWPGLIFAQDCAQEVVGDLFEVLETIDNLGEERLAQSVENLSQQEGWSERERSDFTLAIADNPDVDAAESERTEILGRMFGLIQRGNVDCAEIRQLRATALELEKAQWEAAIKRVEQRIWR